MNQSLDSVFSKCAALYGQPSALPSVITVAFTFSYTENQSSFPYPGDTNPRDGATFTNDVVTLTGTLNYTPGQFEVINRSGFAPLRIYVPALLAGVVSGKDIITTTQGSGESGVASYHASITDKSSAFVPAVSHSHTFTLQPISSYTIDLLAGPQEYEFDGSNSPWLSIPIKLTPDPNTPHYEMDGRIDITLALSDPVSQFRKIGKKT